MTEKYILDACCGSRMFWFNKNDPNTVYMDCRVEDFVGRWKSGNGLADRYIKVNPDIVGDFRQMPFSDETFYHVIFDPPHLLKIGDNAWMKKKYGRLDAETWEDDLRLGFNECMRVLKPHGTLIFKWNEFDIPVKKIIEVIGCEPLYGHRSGKQSKTHWLAFVK